MFSSAAEKNGSGVVDLPNNDFFASVNFANNELEARPDTDWLGIKRLVNNCAVVDGCIVGTSGWFDCSSLAANDWIDDDDDSDAVVGDVVNGFVVIVLGFSFDGWIECLGEMDFF